MKLVVMIPALNEEKTIGHIIRAIPRLKGIETDALVIDDGSSDRTAEIAEVAGAAVVSHGRNRGVGFAFKTGIEKALDMGADIIVNMDGDGQFDPADIKKLIEPITSGKCDFVTCTRFQGRMMGKMPLVKRIGNRMFSSLISSMIGQKFSDTQCGFRAYSREAAMRISVFGDFTYTQEVFIDLAGKGMRMTEVPCTVRAQRQHGRSRVMNKGILNYILRSIIISLRAYRDHKPLVFFGVPGLIFTIIGIANALGSFAYWVATRTTGATRTYVQLAIFFTILGVLVLILALIADMFIRIRKTMDEISYQSKARNK